MITFVNQDKMSPVQLALETARYEFSRMHGSTISRPEYSNYSYVWDSTEANRRIDDALRSLGLRPAVQHTPNE